MYSPSALFTNFLSNDSLITAVLFSCTCFPNTDNVVTELLFSSLRSEALLPAHFLYMFKNLCK